jgi:hypothetical protein
MSQNQEVAEVNGERGPRLSTVKRVLGWLAVILVAVFPFPWWW